MMSQHFVFFKFHVESYGNMICNAKAARKLLDSCPLPQLCEAVVSSFDVINPLVSGLHA